MASTNPVLSAEPVLIFDGYCNMCNATVSFFVARDRGRRLRYTASDSAAAKEIGANAAVASLGAVPAATPSVDDTVYLYDNGVLYERSEAVLRALSYLPLPWRILATARLVPRALRDAAYRKVAVNRYRLFGRKDTCRIPTPEEQELFV